jgi:hypothetical protein
VGDLLGGAFGESAKFLAGWKDTAMAVFEGVGFAIRNLRTIFKVTSLRIAQGFLNIGAHLEAFMKNAQTVGIYIRDNFTRFFIDAFNAVLTALQNLGKNLTSFGSNLFEALFGGGEFGGFQWTPILDGFKATVDKMPAMARPAFVDMGDQITEELGKVGPKVEKALSKTDVLGALKMAGGPLGALGGGGPAGAIAAALAAQSGDLAGALPAAAKGAKTPLGPLAKDKKVDPFTAALQKGTQEAYKAEVRAVQGTGGDKTVEDIAKNTKDQVLMQKRTFDALNKVISKATGAPFSIMPFPGPGT